jgi:GT2 family glycosyltransferase/SAM-dependent methyltransferase
MAKTEGKIGDLEWTGERYLPGVEGDIAIEHLHRYALARELVHGKDVLDIACGEGYGTRLLSETARSAVGIDVAEEVVLHARQRYVQPGLSFELGSCAKIPLEDCSVDVVVSFETIEHHGQHKEMVSEIKRVLRSDGMLIISSPDKHEYSDVPGSENAFHVKELYLNEFSALLKVWFRHVEIYGQRVQYGSNIGPLDSGAAASWYSFSGGNTNIRAVPGIERPLYFIAIASDAPVAALPAGIFADPKAIWRRDEQILTLERSASLLKSEIERWESKCISDEQRFKAEIAQINAARAAEERVRHELEERLRQSEVAHRELYDRLVRLSDLHTQLESYRDRLIREAQTQELRFLNLQQTFLAVCNSPSWRLTAPLRGLKRIAHNVISGSPSDQANGDGTAGTAVLEESAASVNPNLCFGRISKLSPDQVATGISFPECLDPLVSIIVPVYNKIEYTLACLTSIHTYMPDAGFEVIVVDDGSSDETADVVPNITGVRYTRNSTNLGFLRSVNRGASMAKGKYLYLLNNDTELRPGSIDALLTVFERIPSAVLAGSKLVYPGGHLQEAGAVLNADGTVELVGLNGEPAAPEFDFLREVDYCSGASLMIKRESFESLGGFDDAYAPGYFEDADLAMRLRSTGGKIIYQPASVVIHHLSVTTRDYGDGKIAEIQKNKQTFLDRWQATLDEYNRVRLIAFYLPQFHPIPENDKWWGEGFTEWWSVRKGLPNFEGHYQPHVPADLGYYDLRMPEAREAQASLAREYGIHGFCYYYYWFGGKRLLETPLNAVLETREPRFPFCVCWANESWTRKWDGRERDTLMEQWYAPDDDIAFMESLFPLFSDDRYIRINGRPVLLVYRADKLPNSLCTVERWRRRCAEAGFPDPYLVRVHSFLSLLDGQTPADSGFDAAVEFPPHGLGVEAPPPPGTHGEFRGRFHDYIETAKRFRTFPVPQYRLFKSVMPSWDNTARRQHDSHIFLHSNPIVYEHWLREAIATTRRFAVGEERIVFINAWNEWAEGNHLEPDVRYGRGFLEATRRAWESGCGLTLPAISGRSPGEAVLG